MPIKLPEPIATYVKAANAGDAKNAIGCFAEQATVLDEGKTIKGKASIREWMEGTKKQYTYASQPLAFTERGETGILTAKVTGNFPGSPVVLEYRFQIRENLIQDLRITLPD